MARHKGDALTGTQIGQPLPGEDAFHGDDNPFSVGIDNRQKGIRVGPHVAMDENLTIMVEDTDIHTPRTQIDTTVVFVSLGVESHEASSFVIVFEHNWDGSVARQARKSREEASMSIKTRQPTRT